MTENQDNPAVLRQAEDHFRQARSLALRERLTGWLSGRDEHNLLPFEAIRAELRAKNPLSQGLQQIPLEKIVGSVARYDDFTRQFLPLKESLRDRWIRVESFAMRRGWPPVDLYQVGDVYFVSDGNHRVAVARQMGYDTIEAYVWCFPDEIKIDPGESLDSVLLRLEERNFMERTGLAERYPDHGIAFTTPGRYREIQCQIESLRRTLTEIDERPVSTEEATDAWYEMTYLPAVQFIRESELLESFPGRTEADLFVWFSMNREALRRHYGDYDNVGTLVGRIAQERQRPRFRKLMAQVMRLFGRGTAPSPLPELAEERCELDDSD